jgi:HAD superfamily hydrolase (TIGR01509 family)
MRIVNMRNEIFIFDFDGVIVDSLSSLYDIYLDFLKEFKIEGNKDEFNSLNGPSILEIVAILKKKYDIKNETEELFRIYSEKLSIIYANIKLNETISENLKYIKANNFKIVLASSSKKEEIIKVLKKHMLYDLFSYIVSGDDVEKAKPSPEIYNLVKEKYPNHEYYVIEDSLMGIQSATKAGMKTIFFNPNRNIIEENITYEINKLNQIQNIITEIDLNCFTVAKAQQITLKVVVHEPAISISQKQEIEDIWNQELLKRKLFNGKIVSYLSHKKNGDTLHIECFITQYKYFLAQLKNPVLDLKISPIGVSGIILDENNNTLLAERHNVTEYEGFYEFIPAGSIDSSKMKDNFILFQEKLTEEFSEETGIKKEHIKIIQPYCLIFDNSHRVYDICSKIYIKGFIQNLIKSKQNDEYHNIEILNLKYIYDKIKKNNCVPTSRIILNNLE